MALGINDKAERQISVNEYWGLGDKCQGPIRWEVIGTLGINGKDRCTVQALGINGKAERQVSVEEY